MLESTFRVSDVKARVTDNRFAILAMEPFECDVEEWFQVIVGRLERVGGEQGFATMPLSVTARLAFSGNSATCDAEQLLSICVTDSGPAVRLDFSQALAPSFSSPESTPSALAL